MSRSLVLLAAALQLLLATALEWGPEETLCKVCECDSDRTRLDCTDRRRAVLPPANSSVWQPEAPQLQEAVFDGNLIDAVAAFPAMPKLTRLTLRNNAIKKIADAAFQNLTALEELDLSFNQLTLEAFDGDVLRGVYTPPDYMPLGNLTVLRLAGNNFHSLASDMFEHAPRLRVLSLADNPLKIISTSTESALAQLLNLEVLDLSFCNLKTLSLYLLHTPHSLRELNLTGNEMETVPPALQYAKVLRVLRLSQNPIARLDNGSFPEQLSGLEVLELDHMDDLTTIGDGAFSKLSSLTELYVSHSRRLAAIHPRAFSGPNGTLPPLTKLVLRGNVLRTLDSDLLRNQWESLKYVDIEDNAWLCDCNSQWMVDKLEPIVNKTHADLQTNIICVDPEPMRGKNFFDMHERRYTMRCLDADGAHPERDGLLLVGVLVGVLLAIPVTLAGLLLWRRGACPCSDGGPASFSRAFYSRARNDEEF